MVQGEQGDNNSYNSAKGQRSNKGKAKAKAEPTTPAAKQPRTNSDNSNTNGVNAANLGDKISEPIRESNIQTHLQACSANNNGNPSSIDREAQ